MIKQRENSIFLVLERCVMRFICSRSNDGTILESMEILNKIFDNFKNHVDVARGIMILLQSMATYG